MNTRIRDYSRAFLDGCLVGADVFGIARHTFTGDERALGYKAHTRALNYKILGDTGESFTPRFDESFNRGVGEKVCEKVGILLGATSNLLTFGLTGVFAYSEVYCVDERLARVQ